MRISLPLILAYGVLNLFRFQVLKFFKERVYMEWTTPRHEEIDLNCEVSSYANAEL